MVEAALQRKLGSLQELFGKFLGCVATPCVTKCVLQELRDAGGAGGDRGAYLAARRLQCLRCPCSGKPVGAGSPVRGRSAESQAAIDMIMAADSGKEPEAPPKPKPKAEPPTPAPITYSSDLGPPTPVDDTCRDAAGEACQDGRVIVHTDGAATSSATRLRRVANSRALRTERCDRGRLSREEGLSRALLRACRGGELAHHRW